MPKTKTEKPRATRKKSSGTRASKVPDWSAFERRLERIERLCESMVPEDDENSWPIPPQRSALELASKLLQHPGAWLRTPNPNLGDRKPIDLIDTDEESKVFNLLNAVDQGLF
jgi:uncharacterized protein (DUF2384 family)